MLHFFLMKASLSKLRNLKNPVRVKIRYFWKNMVFICSIFDILFCTGFSPKGRNNSVTGHVKYEVVSERGRVMYASSGLRRLSLRPM